MCCDISIAHGRWRSASALIFPTRKIFELPEPIFPCCRCSDRSSVGNRTHTWKVLNKGHKKIHQLGTKSYARSWTKQLGGGISECKVQHQELEIQDVLEAEVLRCSGELNDLDLQAYGNRKIFLGTLAVPVIRPSTTFTRYQKTSYVWKHTFSYDLLFLFYNVWRCGAKL